MADVVVSRANPNLKLCVSWNLEFLSCAGGEPLGRSRQLVFAASRNAFHDLGRNRSKYQGGGQDDAHRLFTSVGHGQAVANALAVEINAGLGGNGDAF